MAESVALQLAARRQPYSDQANFGFCFWPFSLKLLWAPAVDAFYARRIGRRKSWCLHFLSFFIFYSFAPISYFFLHLKSKYVSFL